MLFYEIWLTCKLAISERPARRHTILAGGLASATQRRISASLSSSKSISGEPIRRMVGASATRWKLCKYKQHEWNENNAQRKHKIVTIIIYVGGSAA